MTTFVNANTNNTVSDRERRLLLDQLLANTRPLLYRIATGYRKGDDAEDLAQIAMAALAEAAPAYTPERGTWVAFARGCANRAIKRHLSKQRKLPEVPLDLERAEEEVEEHATEEVQSLFGELILRDLLDDAMLDLTEREATVVRMRFGLTPDGRSRKLREVAEALDITPSGALHIERSGLRKLRLKIQGERGEEERRRLTSYREIARRVKITRPQLWLLEQVTLCGQDCTTLARTMDCHPEQVRQVLKRIEAKIWDAITSFGVEAVRELHRHCADVVICSRNSSMRKDGGGRPDKGGGAPGVTSDDLIFAGVVRALLDD